MQTTFIKAFPLLLVVLLACGLQSCDLNQNATQQPGVPSFSEYKTMLEENARLKAEAGVRNEKDSLQRRIIQLEAEKAADTLRGKLAAYDNLIAAGWGPCCGCKTVKRGCGCGGNGSGQSGKGGYGSFNPTFAPVFSPTFNPTFNPNGGGNGQAPAEYGNTGTPQDTTARDTTTAKRDSTGTEQSATVPTNVKKFEPAFWANILPQPEAAYGGGGLRWNVSDKFALTGGPTFGYRRIKQTHTATDNKVDVRTGTHTVVGATVGATYRVSRRFSAFTSATGWGVDSDDVFFTVGGAIRVGNADVGAAFNFGEEVKGFGLNLQF